MATTRVMARYRGLLLPMGAAMMIFVVLVPLPPLVMDVLLCANIALAAVILMTAITVASPLDFSVFPSVLLVATLVRLVLNIASTRLILTAGAGGADVAAARLAAGHVIWSFSQFVTSGSLAVGVILFSIIAVVQFVVITKGAARISEVAARFVLDAMPGKQMGIDADLNAGTITKDEAHQRRRKISREADFYGAMDGASKFVRGDAIAAVIITLVNIGGGLYVGLVQYGWNWSQTLELFTRLTIGDGLVTQIPALLVSVSAALIVSRSMDREHFAEQVVSQLTSRPVALAITAGFLAALMLTRLPKLPLLVMGIGCAGLAILLTRRRVLPRAADSDSSGTAARDTDPKALNRLLAVEPMQLDVGFALVPLVDSGRGGDLLDRLGALRREVATELGLVMPPIRVRDNLRLRAHEYAIRIRGVKVAAGRVYADHLLAVACGQSTGKLLGRETTEPAFGTPAIWIGPDQARQAEEMGYSLVEPINVMMTHLLETVRQHAAGLLSRQQVAEMLDGLRERAEAVVSEAADQVPLGQIHKVLQRLLAEGVAIRDLETILETLSDHGRCEDVEAVCEDIRRALGGGLCQPYCGPDGKLHCICLDEQLEEAVSVELDARLDGPPTANGPSDRAGNDALGLSPALSEQITAAASAGAERLAAGGYRPVVVCRPRIRQAVRRVLAGARPAATVLGYDEIVGVDVERAVGTGTE